MMSCYRGTAGTVRMKSILGDGRGATKDGGPAHFLDEGLNPTRRYQLFVEDHEDIFPEVSLAVCEALRAEDASAH